MQSAKEVVHSHKGRSILGPRETRYFLLRRRRVTHRSSALNNGVRQARAITKLRSSKGVAACTCTHCGSDVIPFAPSPQRAPSAARYLAHVRISVAGAFVNPHLISWSDGLAEAQRSHRPMFILIGETNTEAEWAKVHPGVPSASESLKRGIARLLEEELKKWEQFATQAVLVSVEGSQELHDAYAHCGLGWWNCLWTKERPSRFEGRALPRLYCLDERGEVDEAVTNGNPKNVRDLTVHFVSYPPTALQMLEQCVKRHPPREDLL